MDAVDEICNRYVSDLVAHSPMLGTDLGRDDRPSELDDLSPDGLAETHRITTEALAAVRATSPGSPGAEVAASTFIERSQVEVDRYDAGLVHAGLNVMHSPVQAVRQVFDLMPTETDDDWANVAARLRAVPAALAGYRASLLEAAGRGVVSARRQAEQCALQCDRWAGVVGDAPFFTALVAGASRPAALQQELEAAASQAAVDVARQKLRAAQWTLERQQVRAPIDGEVVGLEVQVGNAVAAQTELLRLLPKRRLIVRAEVNEAYVAALKQGMQAEIVMEATPGSAPIPARLERIGSVFQLMAPSDDPQERISRRGVECLLSLDNPDKLRVGQRVLVRFLP